MTITNSARRARLGFALAVSILLAPPALCQDPTVGQNAQSSSQTLRWKRGSEGMDAILRDGAEYVSTTHNGVQVVAALFDTGWKTRVELAVSNVGEHRFDFHPETIELELQAPKQEALAYNEPEKLMKSLDRRARWSAALNQAAANASTREEKTTTTTSGAVNGEYRDFNTWRSGTVYGTYHETSETTKTVPDEQAQRQAAERIAQIRRSTGDNIAFIQSATLRPNTVIPGNQLVGVVWFDREKKMEELVLRVPINGEVFEFPFRFNRKK